MDQVLVDLEQRSYPIYIGESLLSKAGQLLKNRVKSEKVMVITNPAVGELYGDVLVEGLRGGGFQVFSTLVPEGEKHKTLAWASKLYDVLLDYRMDRSCAIVALGGGVIGDLAGFVAATFKRGLPFVQVPTTLLAQVDASVGGKVAVDHPRGKNMIGAFYQPRCVLIDLAALGTLPDREMWAGLAEVIKYGVIGDADLFGYLEENLDSVSRREFDPLRFVVKRSCQIKASVITQDEREKDLRTILNFGHTLGHAIEAATDYRLYRHGEAVSIGMVYATDIAVRMDIASEETLVKIRELLERSGLPTGCEKIDPDEIMAFLHQDKKVCDNKVRFVLPLSIGRVTITDAVTEKLIRKVLQENEI